MNRKKYRQWNLGIIGIIGCSIFGYLAGNQSGQILENINGVDAKGVTYTMGFSSTGNLNRFPTSLIETTQTALTTSGSGISIKYKEFTNSDTTWGIIAPGGYVYNTTPISGITNIALNLSNSNTLTLSYGWINRTTGAINYRFTGIALNDVSNTYNFQNQSPDCFKIENLNDSLNLGLTSFSLTYLCSPTVDPYFDSGTEGLVYEPINQTSTMVSEYTGTATNVIIPSRHLGLNVTAIKTLAFSNTAIESISIPSGVTSIGSNAFFFCSSLTYVSLPEGLLTIDIGLFDCSGLVSVTIPSSVTKIQELAFFSCYSLVSIRIPSAVTTIGPNVFYDCNLLTINCEAISKPFGWSADWNPTNCLVIWGV